MQERRITTRIIAERLGVGKEGARKIFGKKLAEKEYFFEVRAALLNGCKRERERERERRVEFCRSFVESVDQEIDVLQRLMNDQ